MKLAKVVIFTIDSVVTFAGLGEGPTMGKGSYAPAKQKKRKRIIQGVILYMGGMLEAVGES